MLEPADRRIIALAIPALGSLAVEPLYVLVDTAIVGRLGTAQLGGLALSATVLALVINACTFLIYGTTERVARRIGAGDRTGAADAGVQAMWLGAIVAVPSHCSSPPAPSCSATPSAARTTCSATPRPTCASPPSGCRR